MPLAAGMPLRFAATKLVEGDRRIEEALQLDQNEKEMIEHIIVQMETVSAGWTAPPPLRICGSPLLRSWSPRRWSSPTKAKSSCAPAAIDKFLTGKYTAIPAFIAIMALVFWLTFNVIGLFFQNLMETGIDALTGIVDTALTNWNVNPVVHSLSSTASLPAWAAC